MSSDRGKWWALLPVGLIAASLAGNAVMISFARDDPSFSVEPDYYKKAVRYDEELAKARRSAELGHRARAKLAEAPAGPDLVVELLDAAGRPVEGATVAVEAFPIARGQEVVRATLRAEGAGLYSAELGRVRRGLWEIRVEANSPAGPYSATLRSEAR